MSKVKIKKNDNVLVTTGKDSGKRGRVLRVYPDKAMVLVERVNMIKRHTKPNPQKQSQGGIVEKEAPIAISKLMVICPETGKPTRVGRKRLENGKGVRVAKVSGATFT
jgi:large subunit ribosomal protein L24